MKNKITVLGMVALAVSLTTYASSYAQLNTSVEIESNTSVQSGKGSATVETEGKVNAENQKSKTEAGTTENTNQKGGEVSVSSQSEVALFVQELLKVADRERGIGAQVRVIAQEQQKSSETSANAIAKVESRSKLKTFFVGSDYKNLGTLRSEMVKTEAQIKQLEQLATKAVTASAKATLTAQIAVLKAAQLKLNTFIEAHAKTFSLFGWLAKKN